MAQTDKELFDLLNAVVGDLEQLLPDDTERLVKVGATLEQALGLMSEDTSGLSEHFSLCLEGLRAVYEKTATDPAQAIEAARAIAAASLEWVSSSEPSDSKSLQSAGQMLRSAMASLPADFDPALVSEFVTECRDYVEGAEASLLALETDPEDAESINTVFRAFHTIKGTSAFLGLDRISELAHRAESLLSGVRDGETRFTGGCAELALQSVDMLKDLLQGVEDALGGEPVVIPEGYGELMNLLANPKAVGAPDDDGQDDATSLTDVANTLRTQKRLASVESSVRVRTDRLDRLIDMVGELVIAHSMVAQDEVVVLPDHHELANKVAHAGKIVRELQYLSMSMRMVPLKPTFQKMARLARDLAHKNGKLVNFIADDEDTEIDRNMVDVISDPLVHMVRNAVDHGIEPPDVREANGKPRTGAIHLSAYHSGGSVVVEIRDDGKGLDREKIVQKALSRGLISNGSGMSDTDIFDLILQPGFSTAEEVTDVSGRGVGLDVVRKNVEAARGRIEISSQPGGGSTFTLRLPLTLAVTDGMLIRVGAERFIIPTISIHVTFRPEQEALSTVTGRGELVMLRGEPMPVFRLYQLFGIQGAVEEPTEGLLVVLDDGDRRAALLVDELLGQQHVVAKSLPVGVQGISGGAILGDGRVGLIIDPVEVILLARQGAASGGGDGIPSRIAA